MTDETSADIPGEGVPNKTVPGKNVPVGSKGGSASHPSKVLDQGPRRVYGTRIRVSTAILVGAFIALLFLFGFTSQRYGDPNETPVRPAPTSEPVEPSYEPTPEPTQIPSSELPSSEMPQQTDSESTGPTDGQSPPEQGPARESAPGEQTPSQQNPQFPFLPNLGQRETPEAPSSAPEN